ncbi:MAG: methyl-accepting chemotaxis protein, partial [Neisseriaceae bacterium]
MTAFSALPTTRRFKGISMKLFVSLKVSSRMYLMVALSVLGLLLLSALSLWQMRDSMLEERRDKLRNLVEYAHTQMAYYDAQATAGRLTLQQAQQQAAEALRSVRYDQDEYFWINDMQPAMVMHPIKRELQGKPLAQIKDSDGKALFVEFVRVAQAKGAGFVDYQWPRPGVEAAVPKLSYVMAYQPWGWIVGTGIYIDDVDAAFHRQAMLLGGISAALLVLMLLAGRAICGSIVHTLGGEPAEATAIMGRVASGDLTAQVGNRPAGSLLHSLGGMAQALRELIAQVRDSAVSLAQNAEQIR